MRTLVFLEHHDGQIQKGSLGVLTKAASLGDAAGILVGTGARDAASEAGAMTEVLALSEPPPRGETRKIEDDGNAATQIVEFLADRRLI